MQDQSDINNSGLNKEISLLSWQPKRLNFVRSRHAWLEWAILSGNASPNCAYQATNRLSISDYFPLFSRYTYSHHRYVFHKNGCGQAVELLRVFHFGFGCPKFYLLVTLRHVASEQYYYGAYSDWIGVSNSHDFTCCYNFQSAQRQSVVFKQVYYSGNSQLFALGNAACIGWTGADASHVNFTDFVTLDLTRLNWYD